MSCTVSYEDSSLLELAKRIKIKDLSANIELASRVCQNRAVEVDYFLDDLCKPISKYVETQLFYNTEFSGDAFYVLYQQTSSPYDEDAGLPRWKMIASYRGDGNCSLFTYVNKNIIRYCLNKLKQAEKKQKKLQEKNVFETLLQWSWQETIEEPDDEQLRALARLKIAFAKLKEKDRKIIQYLVIDKRKPIEVFDEMKIYIKSGKPFDQWSDEDKQNGMSWLKIRAIKHLNALFSNND